MIRALLDKSRGKLAAAEDWLTQGKYFDDIVSRCYYSAFHAAQAMLPPKGSQQTRIKASSRSLACTSREPAGSTHGSDAT
jgi:uncharacterized protein (UPF0332 family)